MLKFMKFLFIAMPVFFIGCTTTPQNEFIKINSEPHNSSWWLRSEYFPNGKSIRGVPIDKISKEWCAANEFTIDEHLKYLSERDGKEIEDHANFSIYGSFDGKNEMEAISGVYQKCTGEKGNFIITIVKLDTNKIKIISVLEMSKNSAGLMSLSPVSSDAIRIWWCFGCDFSSLIKWDSSVNNFVFQKEEESEDF